MPDFSDAGNDTYICQHCMRTFDAVEFPPVRRTITSASGQSTYEGNVCPDCEHEIINDDVHIESGDDEEDEEVE